MIEDEFPRLPLRKTCSVCQASIFVKTLVLNKTIKELVKFASPNDVAYKRILSEIKKMIQPLSLLALELRREDRG
jgi:hypothetical protein